MNNIIFIALFALFLVGCAEPGGPQHSLATPEIESPSERETEEVLSFSKDILPLVEARCALCHTGDFLPDWSVYENVIEYQEKIFTRVVVNKSMPLNNQTNMTQEERDTFELWINQGLDL